MSDSLDLDLARRSVVVRLKHDDGNTRVYTLRELDGRQRDSHFSRLKGVSHLGPDGKLRVTNIDKLQSSLIAASLYDEAGKLVPEETIVGWPARVLEKLAQTCDEINALDDEAVMAVGNGSAASGASGTPSPPS